MLIAAMVFLVIGLHRSSADDASVEPSRILPFKAPRHGLGSLHGAASAAAVSLTATVMNAAAMMVARPMSAVCRQNTRLCTSRNLRRR